MELSFLLRLLLAVIVPQALLGFDDFGNFEENWSGTMWDALLLEFIYAFLMIRLGLWVFEGKTAEVKCRFHHIVTSVHATNIIYDCLCCT